MPTARVFSVLKVQKTTHQHRYFLHLLVILFFIWSLYRFIFVGIPVFVDEAIAKLIFFALPVWLYVILTQAPLLYDELRTKRLLPGLFLGLAFGGLFGFVATLATLSGKNTILIAPVFISFSFWWEFFLGLLTGFWESVFFFGWVYATLELAFPRWNIVRVSLFNMLVFVIYHLPNTLIRFDAQAGIPVIAYLAAQMFLLGCFAIGQGLLFYRYRNLYLLTMTHAIWGTVLLVFSG